jgi:adenosylcobyric acid synthase
MADLHWLREQGFEAALRQRIDAGAFVVGLCGGYQMLGERLEDPEGVESSRPEAPGLGFLPMTTRFCQDKALYQVEAVHQGTGLPVRGYEIHMGGARAESPYDRLADAFEQHLDMALLQRILDEGA